MKLTPALLHRALKAVFHHGYGTFLPEPPELKIVKANWATLVKELAAVDLDVYQGYEPILSFAPKTSRLNVRRVGLLHPYDMIFYTGLALNLKVAISKSRLSSDKVFSYRTEGTKTHELYRAASGWQDFRNAIAQRAASNSGCIVGVTDVADFYPRIYHHRLINALGVSSGAAMKDCIRALEKMLDRFSDGTSYGIPVGPPASRLLGEAVLIDVDSTLVSFGIDFIRFVDDYVIFAKRIQDAEYGIRVLGETLFRNHGLTLQTAKTKVVPASDM